VLATSLMPPSSGRHLLTLGNVVIALACIVAGLGGLVTFVEGKRVKRVEGVAPSEAVEAEIRRTMEREDGEGDLELGRVKTAQETVLLGGMKGKGDGDG